MSRMVNVIIYKRVIDRVKVSAWPLLDDLTLFEAEAHIIDGIAYVEIDFRYGDNDLFCAKVYAQEPSDIVWMIREGHEWIKVPDERIAFMDDDGALMLYDLSTAARDFAAVHFWNEED